MNTLWNHTAMPRATCRALRPSWWLPNWRSLIQAGGRVFGEVALSLSGQLEQQRPSR
ncbi:MAG: hypothetical protein AB1758_21130 [Candidatus Eremiobacterota bacterium]